MSYKCNVNSQAREAINGFRRMNLLAWVKEVPAFLIWAFSFEGFGGRQHKSQRKKLAHLGNVESDEFLSPHQATQTLAKYGAKTDRF